ncbi:MAG TPA: hypothetical protein VLX68_05905 [Chitinivibrionales bacterium]|nr:hypothetical protein [Chitinivibrionales bacterium]
MKFMIALTVGLLVWMGVWGNRRSVRQEDTEIKSEEDVPAERTDTNQLASGLFKDLKDSLQNAGYIHLTESEKKELKELVGGQNPAPVEIVSPITIVQKKPPQSKAG